jgi:phospholipid/cholesterol/gamma-HCH transport system ATP-binding protein
MVEPLIRLTNVSCVRDGYKILDKVSLDVTPGQCTIIMGFSGSGRTTLLKVAAGLIPPESGEVFIEGKNIGKMSEKEIFLFRGRSGFVFQDAALWANMNAYQNIALPLQFHNREMTPAEAEAKIRELVKEFDFRDNLTLRPASLSSGERKQVSYIRAMALDPDIIFLDDPTGAIDNSTSERILQIMKKHKQQGKTILMATHNSTYTAQLADYFVVLKEGVIVEQGDIQKVTRSTNPYVIDVLSENLSQAAVYDTDLLNLLETDPEQ